MTDTPKRKSEDLPRGYDRDTPEHLEDLPEGDGVLVLSPQHRIMSANLQAEGLLKRRLSAGKALTLEQIFDPDSLPQAELALREAWQGGHSRSGVKAMVRPEAGAPLPVVYSVSPVIDESGRIIGATLTFHEENYLHRGLLRADHPVDFEFNTLFENLAEGVFTINNHWRITSFNQRAQEITGFKLEEVLGRPCADIFKSDLCQTACPLRATLESGVTRFDQDVRIADKHGRKVPILVNTSILKDRRNRVIGAVETFRPLIPSDFRKKPEDESARTEDIIGHSQSLVAVINKLPDVAASEASVVLEGESGTGKELFARAIHALSPRAAGPFVAVNCSALAETLLESELFGHEKAAFTGAVNSKVGRFELSSGGTLFLDEVAEIKPDIQVKLLRVLEEKVFERVGGTRSISMDARIISATNRSLIKEVRQGRFRDDLFYRLHTVPLYLPPLRERVEDIPILVSHFMEKLNQKYKKRVRGVDPKVLSIFTRYHWPGNVRELVRIMEYAFVFVKGPIITPTHLPEMEREDRPDIRKGTPGARIPWEDERQAIVKALEKAGGRRKEAARLLGLSRSSLWRKMKAYHLF
ncbi:MAG: sigma 54-interacting transcriptional regulator [Pseudomonadota bacterium]